MDRSPQWTIGDRVGQPAESSNGLDLILDRLVLVMQTTESDCDGDFDFLFYGELHCLATEEGRTLANLGGVASRGGAAFVHK